jgi:hypothetical protein
MKKRVNKGKAPNPHLQACPSLACFITSNKKSKTNQHCSS